MLDQLKLMYVEILIDYAQDNIKSPAVSMERIEKTEAYLDLISYILKCKDLGELRDLIMKVKETNEGLYDTLWLLFNKEFQKTTQLPEKIAMARSIGEQQRYEWLCRNRARSGAHRTPSSSTSSGTPSSADLSAAGSDGDISEHTSGRITPTSPTFVRD